MHNNQNFSPIQLGTFGISPVAYTLFPTGKSSRGVNRKELINWNGCKLEEVIQKAEV